MENQLEKKMENIMDIVLLQGLVGVVQGTYRPSELGK